MIRAAILPTKTTLPCDKTRLQLTYGIFSPHIRSENAPWAELNWDGEIIARTVREGGREGEQGCIFQAARQILSARLPETRLSLLGSSDPLCVVSTAIKQSSLFVAHMWSEGEVLMKYEGPSSLRVTELDVPFAPVYLLNFSLSHPESPRRPGFHSEPIIY